MPTLNKAAIADYDRLKRLEQTGHVLTTDGLRLIIKACQYDPAEVGKVFLETYARWHAAEKKGW